MYYGIQVPYFFFKIPENIFCGLFRPSEKEPMKKRFVTILFCESMIS